MTSTPRPDEGGARPPAAAGARLTADVHDRRLVENVAPPDWTNPPPRRRYNLVVVGGGPGGLVAAAIAAALGARVALVEKHLLGGDCLNTGCVPSKAVLRASRAWRDAREAEPRFGGPGVAGGGDFGAAMERMRRIRAEISVHDGARRFADLGVDVFFGTATFTALDAVRVGDATLRFRRCIVATGSRPFVPSIAGLEEAGYHTSDTIFSIESLPARLAVVGGGAVGCELAQAFAGFGARVTIVEAGGSILPAEDPEAAAVVAGSLQSDGVEILTGATVTAVTREGGVRTLLCDRGGHSLAVEAEMILMATGRTPNVDELALEAASVRLDPRGRVAVDERLATGNPRIYAIGDAVSPAQYTHLADAHARMAVRNALFRGRAGTGRLVVPRCTYTDPELAQVGISWEDARRRGTRVRTITVPFADVDRARLDGNREGFLRMHVEGRSGTIVGATLVGENAGDLISQITQAIVAGIGIGRLGDAIYPYPTRAEVVRKAADEWRRGKLTPMVRRLFGWYFRLQR